MSQCKYSEYFGMLGRYCAKLINFSLISQIIGIILWISALELHVHEWSWKMI